MKFVEKKILNGRIYLSIVESMNDSIIGCEINDFIFSINSETPFETISWFEFEEFRLVDDIPYDEIIRRLRIENKIISLPSYFFNLEINNNIIIVLFKSNSCLPIVHDWVDE